MSNLIPIDILGHADFSARFKKSKDSPGLAAFGTQIDRIRDQNPAGTLLLDAGDQFCSRLWDGLTIVETLSFLKTDAMTLGNHEFDRGREFLESCVEHADFPVLCANIVEKATGKLVKGTKPWIILERSGVRIGILGLTTEYTPFMVTAASFAPYEVRSSVALCEQYIPEMRKAGAQIIIVLAHFPFYVDEDGTLSGELYDVLTKIPPVDVFIGGHIPGDYAGICQNTAVVKGGFGGNSLPHVRLWFDPEKDEVINKECAVHLTKADADVKEEYRVCEERLVAPLRGYLDAILAVAEEEMTIHLASETKLGNLLADSACEGASAQIAYLNATSAGGGIQPGPVTVEDILSVVGYNDYIFRTEMTGRQIWDLFELVYEPERFGNNAGLFFSGVIVSIDHTRPAGKKVLAVALRDGTPVEMERKYTVATSEYMASGGNDTSSLSKTLKWENTQKRIYDALFAYLRRDGTMRVSPEKRLYENGTPENNHAPF
jgi:2',3'-cyclic-nucleotide 2'-phosphodiesterase/3'-nucleotidase